VVRERYERVMAGFAKSKASPALGKLPKDRRLDVPLGGR
jgi:hypothetical protein